MKRFICVFITLVLALCLTACDRPLFPAASSENQTTEKDETIKENTSDVIVDDSTLNSEDDKMEKTFEIGKEYIYSFNNEQKTQKIEFITPSDNLDYRFTVKTNVTDTRLNGTITFELYDEEYMEIASESYAPRYDNSPYYTDEFSFDVHLKESKKYTLKISTVNATGEFSACISTMVRDAGHEQESATPIVVGEKIEATLNSTVHDWYVCVLDEGKYEVVFNNIDIGCAVEVSIKEETNVSQGFTIKDCDSEKRTITMYRPMKIYISVKAQKNIADGNYILMINKTV